MITIKKQLNQQTAVVIKEETQKEAVRQMAFFDQIPSQCPKCGAAIRFQHRTPQDYEYFELVCDGKPSHQITLGQHKDSGTLFYKNSEEWLTWDQIKQRNQQQAGGQQPPPRGGQPQGGRPQGGGQPQGGPAGGPQQGNQPPPNQGNQGQAPPQNQNQNQGQGYPQSWDQ